MPLQKSILFIGANALLRDCMVDLIEQNGEFAPVAESSTDAAMDFLASAAVDLIILDQSACIDQSSAKCVEELRTEYPGVPLLVLTSSPAEWNVGGESTDSECSFLEKPFSIRDLYMRIHTVLGNHERAGRSSFAVGMYSVDPFKMKAEHPNGDMVSLTEKETVMLQCLHRASGSVVSKDELKRQVFGYSSEIDTHTAVTHINKIRYKLEENPRRPQFILTDRGGYRLVN